MHARRHLLIGRSRPITRVSSRDIAYHGHNKVVNIPSESEWLVISNGKICLSVSSCVSGERRGDNNNDDRHSHVHCSHLLVGWCKVYNVPIDIWVIFETIVYICWQTFCGNAQSAEVAIILNSHQRSASLPDTVYQRASTDDDDDDDVIEQDSVTLHRSYVVTDTDTVAGKVSSAIYRISTRSACTDSGHIGDRYRIHLPDICRQQEARLSINKYLL